LQLKHPIWARKRGFTVANLFVTADKLRFARAEVNLVSTSFGHHWYQIRLFSTLKVRHLHKCHPLFIEQVLCDASKICFAHWYPRQPYLVTICSQLLVRFVKKGRFFQILITFIFAWSVTMAMETFCWCSGLHKTNQKLWIKQAINKIVKLLS
jgi:hypothetical protein